MLALAVILLAGVVQDPVKQVTCSGEYPLSITDVAFSSSGLKPSTTTSFKIEGENDSDDTIFLSGVTIFLYEGMNSTQAQFELDNVLSVAPDQEFELRGTWEPTVLGWQEGSAEMYVYLGDTDDELVGCTKTDVNISGVALSLAALSLLSL